MLQEAVAVEDINHRIIIVNRAFCKLTGFTEKEWIVVGSLDLIISDAKEEFSNKINIHLPQDSFEFDFLAQRKDQSFFQAKLKASPVKDDDNHLVGRIITLADVTQASQQIEKQRLISTIEASPLFVVMMDSNGLRYMNLPGRTMLGYGAEEDISQLGVKDLMSSDSADVIFNKAIPAAVENGFWQGQTTFRRKDGSEFNSQQIIIAHKDSIGNIEFFSSIARDITDQLKAEQVLKENQQRLRYFMEESLEAIIIHEEGTIADFNTAAYKMFGYDPDELKGKLLLSLFETSFHKEISERITRIKVLKDEWVGVKKDGTLFDVEIYSRSHIYKDKEVRIISVLDISARKKTERALRSSELFLNAAVEGTNVGIWEWNLVTNKMTFNEAWRKLRRVRRDQVPGSFDEWKQTVLAEDLPGLLEALKNHLRGLTPMFHYVYRSSAGEGDIVIEAKGKLVRDENNMPVRIVGTAVDITDRQKMEDALRKSRAQLAALIENREETIWAIDSKFRLTDFNNSFALIYKKLFDVDVKHGDLIAHPLSVEEQAKWRHRYQKCLQGESLSFVEDLLIDDEKVFIEFAANPMRVPDGTIIGVSVLGRNITQQKNFERSLQQAKNAAEAANRTKSQFLANISHEIRTPMNGIIGFTDLLLQTKVNDKQKEYLDIVRYSADSLLQLINDLLDLSKIEAGKLLLGNREYDIRKLLRAIIKSFKPKAKQQHLSITLSIDRSVPAIVVGDEMRLQQIFVNIIGNAVKFSDHGTVEVRLKRQNSGDEKVILYAEVKDEGIGIPKDRQEAIFEAFHQLGDPYTSKYGGTGLGLSITKRLISMMDGTIGVDSEPGKGSLFHFTVDLGLPVKK